MDPRVSADPAMRAVFTQYPHIGKVIPAIGYDAGQLAALRATLNRAEADVVVSATPLDLTALIGLNKPVVRARYEFADAGTPTLGALVDRFLARGRRALTSPLGLVPGGPARSRREHLDDAGLLVAADLAMAPFSWCTRYCDPPSRRHRHRHLDDGSTPVGN